MTVMPIQDATSSFDCKIPGCPNTARHNRGPTAYLCDDHAAARNREAPARPAPRPASQTLADQQAGFEQKAKALVTVGRDLDRAITRFKPAKAQLEVMMERWRRALAQLASTEEPRS